MGMSRDIRTFVEDKVGGVSPNLDLEIVVYTLFHMLNEKIKKGTLPKDKVELMLKASFNQYFSNSSLDLFVQKLEFPQRFDIN